MADLKKHQPAMDVDSQIKNLKDLGLCINDVEFAKSVLNEVSYFRLIKAYSLQLKEKNSNFHSGISFEHMPSGIDTLSVFVHKPEFEGKEQQVLAAIHRLTAPDSVDIDSDVALIAVVGRSMKSNHGVAARIFAALAHNNINIKMIDQGSSELNIIIGVSNSDFDNAIKAIYDIFVTAKL